MTQITPRESRLGTGPIVIHIRFGGVSFDIPLTSLDIGTATADTKVKRALATRLLVNPDRLDGHVIDRLPDGNLSIRPDGPDFYDESDDPDGHSRPKSGSPSGLRPLRRMTRRRGPHRHRPAAARHTKCISPCR
jgi:hypothetical protein